MEALISTVLAIRKVLPLNLSKEMGHACFRLAAILGYFIYLALAYFTGHISSIRNAVIGLSAFFIFAVIWIGVVGLSLSTFRTRRLISIVLDPISFSFAVFYAGELMAPVMWAPALMVIGNGLRNGPKFARLSGFTAVVFTSAALWFSPHWNTNPLVYEGMVAAILILPWFTLSLAAHVARANREMQVRAAIFESASRTDSLTELLNRTGFFQVLQKALDDTREKSSRSAVMLVDLDGFKAVNDACGHSAGDRTLKEVAACLRGCFRSGDKVARIGGDEFGIVLFEVPNHEAVERLAQKAIDAISEIQVPCRPDLRLGASIGICCLTPEGCCDDGGAVMDTADKLMYQAKRGGKNQFRIASAYSVCQLDIPDLQ
ncbi:MAG TPA: GGDEF domain-containing protein [Noviherbaspirillum sp.]|nr:GGDEF domain-containing protein [Noviherbaspirillum sp.]